MDDPLPIASVRTCPFDTERNIWKGRQMRIILPFLAIFDALLSLHSGILSITLICSVADGWQKSTNPETFGAGMFVLFGAFSLLGASILFGVFCLVFCFMSRKAIKEKTKKSDVVISLIGAVLTIFAIHIFAF